ncbi:molybdenum cofactor guanylyltransferase MobA [Vibrio sp. Isolate25]|uniref:molybdenum cofactor guanylyltransferase MobA n=1 Tax=Vibrio TaxID=662 RepID=UPI001EFE0DE4|nr:MULTISPECIES: molybdenum cofactor guanylyltransferase MobA [Vibrio]MCG9597496.1 molybdenum cofactor guanylyltransferase MobA [Vibrio sp. Isolate25]MCG9678903.1 molybdenum cofactor guanylyltransferase MobA [Vibrio sp. Isolate24]MCG9682927.1 molybdenum cofactor guanylyltransferase MobA [Vibrio sp. Isolate23]USD31230.1 molybdenum cofactor guanylyltransferase MobA [Vibrio sp. SCSIO 43186]USD44276.1 molybdenum cofactor guanylyltransferase MobA [Vibrio sp. SCSIO 43145]
MLLPTQTSWVILAGGQARRMGGKDKGLIELDNKPLIQHVFERLSKQVSDIMINANRNQEIYSKYATVIGDEIKDFPGPMGGIHAGLSAANKDWVGFVPCDSPQISMNLVERFCAAAQDDYDILVAHDGDFQQPVFTLYHKRVLPKLTAFLERGDRKITLLYKECKTRNVDFSDANECFVNLNTPIELAQFGTVNQ